MLGKIIHIRKYPNRRLYDTSQSAFITSEELYAIVRSGHRIEVTDSATGADITNIVLLNAMIDRDPERIKGVSKDIFHALAAGEANLEHAYAGNGEIDRLSQELFAAKAEVERLNAQAAAKNV